MRNQNRVGTIGLPHVNQTMLTVLTLTDYRLRRLIFVSADCVCLDIHFSPDEDSRREHKMHVQRLSVICQYKV